MIYKYQTAEQTAFVDTEKETIHCMLYRKRFKCVCRSSFTFKETRRIIAWENKRFPGQKVEALPAHSFRSWQRGELAETVSREEMEKQLSALPGFMELQKAQDWKEACKGYSS